MRPSKPCRHGTLERRVDADVEEAEAVWAALSDVGIDIDDVSAQLEREGIDSFSASFDDLIQTLEHEATDLHCKPWVGGDPCVAWSGTPVAGHARGLIR